MNEIDRERLLDMLEYARKAVRILGASDAQTLTADETSFLAVSYALQVVGEAASKVSLEARSAIPTVSWQDAIAMRHRLVHGYRVRSAEIIKQTVAEKLPELICLLERAVGDTAGGSTDLSAEAGGDRRG